MNACAACSCGLGACEFLSWARRTTAKMCHQNCRNLATIKVSELGLRKVRAPVASPGLQIASKGSCLLAFASPCATNAPLILLYFAAFFLFLSTPLVYYKYLGFFPINFISVCPRGLHRKSHSHSHSLLPPSMSTSPLYAYISTSIIAYAFAFRRLRPSCSAPFESSARGYSRGHACSETLAFFPPFLPSVSSPIIVYFSRLDGRHCVTALLPIGPGCTISDPDIIFSYTIINPPEFEGPHLSPCHVNLGTNNTKMTLRDAGLPQHSGPPSSRLRSSKAPISSLLTPKLAQLFVEIRAKPSLAQFFDEHFSGMGIRSSLLFSGNPCRLGSMWVLDVARSLLLKTAQEYLRARNPQLSLSLNFIPHIA